MRGSQGRSGATLLFGPRSARIDLMLAAQFLIDDLRADGRRIGSLKVTEQTLRLRLDGLELALALSAGPLPLGAMGGALCQPALAAPSDDGGAAPFTDLTRVRLIRSLRQHQTALGVLLRQRGAGPGADDLDAELRQVLLTLAEVAAPGLVVWQPTGVVWSWAEFAQAGAGALARPGSPLPAAALMSHQAEGEGERALADGRMPAAAANGPALPDRAARAQRKSAGRLFDRAGRPTAVLLPRIDRPAARLADALRAEPDAPVPQGRRRGLLVVAVAVIAILWLPPLSGLKAMLP